MKSQRTQSFSDSIVVWPDDLKYFDKFLHDNFAKIEYEASCEDDTKLKPESLADLLDYENPDFKRLEAITIKASDGQLIGDSVEIQIGKAGFLSEKTGIVNLKFNDVKEQYPIEDEVLKRINSMRPWYYLLNKLSFKLFLPLCFVLLIVILNAKSLMQKITSHVPPAPAQAPLLSKGESDVLQLAIFGLAFVVGYIIDHTRDYLFPRSFFCIGRQKKSFDRRRNTAYLIFGVIILGIMINIISNVIYQPFLK